MLKIRFHKRDVGIGERIIVKLFLEKQSVTPWSWFTN
jgi:hypothetical protein